MVSTPGYLTTADAIAYLRTTERTLYRLLAAGKIPALRVGHQWRFRQADLERWVEAQQAPSRSSADGDAPVAAPPARNCRVLVVDDERSASAMLMNVLGTIGHDVEVVPDGLTARALLLSDRFDLVVMSLSMAGVEGQELASEAKRLWPSIKVINTADPVQSRAIAPSIDGVPEPCR